MNPDSHQYTSMRYERKFDEETIDSAVVTVTEAGLPADELLRRVVVPLLISMGLSSEVIFQAFREISEEELG